MLYQRQDRSAAAALRKLAAKSKLPEGRAAAITTLDGLGLLDERTLLDALGDVSPDARIHALRFVEGFASDSPTVRAKLAGMADDASLQVRYQVAFSLGAASGPASANALARIALKDAKNSWIRMAILSSLSRGADTVFQRLATHSDFRKSAHGSAFLAALAGQIGAAGRDSEIAVVLKMLGNLPAQEKPLSEKWVMALVAKQSGANRERILAAVGGQASAILDDMLKEAKVTAVDARAKDTARVDAIRSLRFASFGVVRPLIVKLLQPAQPPTVQAAALETVASYRNEAVADLLLSAWPGLSPKSRARCRNASVTARLARSFP